MFVFAVVIDTLCGLEAIYGGVGVGVDFHGVAHGRCPSYCECGFQAGIVIR
jgi:hypothetical protein